MSELTQRFVPIPEKRVPVGKKGQKEQFDNVHAGLGYDKYTGIVHYVEVDYVVGRGNMMNGLDVYHDENGKMCRFVDGELKPIG